MGTDASTIADGVTLDGETGDLPPRALVVYHRDGLQVVPLRPDQPLVIGRTDPSDLQPRSRRLSRRHASFVLEDGEVWVEDLGSTNGTFLNGRRIEQRTRFRVGDEITLGSVTVSLHGLDEAWLRPLGLEGHDRFQAVVEAELERARTFDRGLAVLMLRSATDQGPRLASWVPRLQELLRLVDRAALFGPDTVEILLPEADAAHAIATARELVERLSDRTPLCCGVAIWPSSGATADELIEAARASALQADDERRVVVHRENALAPAPDADGPVVRHAAMVALYRTVDRVASSTISVLVVGETGTGKEVIARAIHERSDRREAPLRVINCGAIPENLVESLLFGHERGAFTGADQRRTGVFEEAEGGTVFLDEIGELSLQAQVALLRVLETRRIQRVGASKELPVDVRVIAATHRDLEAMCEEGRFRWDLLYRLNPITLRVPALRERVEEIRHLVERFIVESNRANGRRVRGITPEAALVLERYSWPGNVRELKNTVDRAVVISVGESITLEDLPERVVGHPDPTRSNTESATPTLAHRADERPAPALDFKERVKDHEIALIRAALGESRGNQTRAADLLGMPRRTLVYKIRGYGIESGDPEGRLPRETDRRGRSLDFAARVARFERGLIEEALARSGGDAGHAARVLNIQKRTLLAKIDREA